METKTIAMNFMGVMMQAAAEDVEKEPFIHSITWPKPMCILGYKYQFHDIVRVCCHPEQSIISLQSYMIQF